MNYEKWKTLTDGAFFKNYPMDIFMPDLGSKFFSCKAELPFSPSFPGSKTEYGIPLSLTGLKMIREEIIAGAERIERAVQIAFKVHKKSVGWFEVKAGKGKGKTTQCSLMCDLFVSARRDRQGEHPLEKSKWCACPVATSLLVFDNESKTTFAPAWAVLKGMEGVRERSRPRHQYWREPVDPVCWPHVLKNEWINLHFKQLPAKEKVTKASRREKYAQKKRAKEFKEQARLKAEKEAQQKAELLESKKKREEAKKKRFAELPRKNNVSIRWKEWSRSKGRFISEEFEADGVDLLFAGKRTYVIFPDGKEMIKKTDNVEIL